MTYFRNLVEAHAAGTLSDRAVEQLLGPENASPHFDKSLRIISPDQIFQRSDVPIGRGANGVVYAALWRRPPGVLASMRKTASEVAIVMKEITPRILNPDIIQKFLTEVRDPNAQTKKR